MSFLSLQAALAWKTNLCSLFEMEVEIKQGISLIARDRSGMFLASCQRAVLYVDDLIAMVAVWKQGFERKKQIPGIVMALRK